MNKKNKKKTQTVAAPLCQNEAAEMAQATDQDASCASSFGGFSGATNTQNMLKRLFSSSALEVLVSKQENIAGKRKSLDYLARLASTVSRHWMRRWMLSSCIVYIKSSHVVDSVMCVVCVCVYVYVSVCPLVFYHSLNVCGLSLLDCFR